MIYIYKSTTIISVFLQPQLEHVDILEYLNARALVGERCDDRVDQVLNVWTLWVFCTR